MDDEIVVCGGSCGNDWSIKNLSKAKKSKNASKAINVLPDLDKR